MVGVIAVTGALFYYGTLYFHTHFYSIEANVTDLNNVDNIQKMLYEKNEQANDKSRTDKILRKLHEKHIQDKDVSSTDNSSSVLDVKDERIIADSKKSE